MTAGPVPSDGRARVLAGGNQLPMLGLGVWQVPDGPACVNAVRWALDLGYRHIDTAQAYGNEQSVGIAFARERSAPRRCSSLPSSIRAAKTQPPKPSEVSDGSVSTRSICISSTGPEVVLPGRGQAWSGPASLGTPVLSAFPTSAPPNWNR